MNDPTNITSNMKYISILASLRKIMFW